MTGKELVAALRKAKGKISAPILFGEHNVPYLFVEKADLMQYVAKWGDKETGMTIENDGFSYCLERDYSKKQETPA